MKHKRSTRIIYLVVMIVIAVTFFVQIFYVLPMRYERAESMGEYSLWMFTIKNPTKGIYIVGVLVLFVEGCLGLVVFGDERYIRRKPFET